MLSTPPARSRTKVAIFNISKLRCHHNSQCRNINLKSVANYFVAAVHSARKSNFKLGHPSTRLSKSKVVPKLTATAVQWPHTMEHQA